MINSRNAVSRTIERLNCGCLHVQAETLKAQLEDVLSARTSTLSASLPEVSASVAAGRPKQLSLRSPQQQSSGGHSLPPPLQQRPPLVECGEIKSWPTEGCEASSARASEGAPLPPASTAAPGCLAVAAGSPGSTGHGWVSSSSPARSSAAGGNCSSGNLRCCSPGGGSAASGRGARSDSATGDAGSSRSCSQMDVDVEVLLSERGGAAQDARVAGWVAAGAARLPTAAPATTRRGRSCSVHAAGAQAATPRRPPASEASACRAGPAQALLSPLLSSAAEETAAAAWAALAAANGGGGSDCSAASGGGASEDACTISAGGCAATPAAFSSVPGGVQVRRCAQRNPI